MYLFESLLWILLGIYLTVKLLYHMLILLNSLTNQNHQIGFHSSYTNLHFHQQCTVLQFLHILANTSFSVHVFIIAMLMGVKQCFIIVLICVSPVTRDVDIFSCAYWSLGYHLWRNVIQSLCPFFNLVVSLFICFLTYMSFFLPSNIFLLFKRGKEGSGQER